MKALSSCTNKTFSLQVKNKAPAEIQITAEQLLREAKERDLEILPPPPKQKISDPEELRDYQHRKRKAFEDNIRKNRLVGLINKISMSLNTIFGVLI